MRFGPIAEGGSHQKKRIFVPRDFEHVIAHISGSCALVGGQAVAWWQQQFCPEEKPITSCDIDFWGHRDDVAALAKALKRKPIYPGEYEMTIWAGAVELVINGEQSLVDFLSSVPGLDSFDPEKVSVMQAFDCGKNSTKLSVLSPVSLALSKLHSLRNFDQANGQDLAHLKTCLGHCRHFIPWLLKNSGLKQVFWNLERLIGASEIKPYRRLETQYGFRILSAVPMAELEAAALASDLRTEERRRLDGFLKERWPRVGMKSKPHARKQTS